MVSLQQGLRADGFEVSMVQLCRWFGVARRTVHYRPTKAPQKVQDALAAPIKALIEAEPSFGYRTDVPPPVTSTPTLRSPAEVWSLVKS